MAAYNKFNSFMLALATKKHDLSADIVRLLLTNTAPLATNAVKADITEIAAGNGYAAGGPAVAIASVVQAAGTTTVTGTDVTIAAAGGSIGPFRYAVLYNATAGLLIGWWDRGSAVTLVDGDSTPVDFDPNGSNVLFTLA